MSERTQKYWARIVGFVNRMKFRLANWLLRPFNLMIVSATDFRSVVYVQEQMAMFVERSGALPQRLKARKKLRQYLEAQRYAIGACMNLSENPVMLSEMPPHVQALAQVLQEALDTPSDGGGDSGTRLAKSTMPAPVGINDAYEPPVEG